MRDGTLLAEPLEWPQGMIQNAVSAFLGDIAPISPPSLRTARVPLATMIIPSFHLFWAA